MKRKIISTFCMIFIFFNLNTYVIGSPAYFFPEKYNITIKNVTKNEIKSIELIYDSGYGFNYESNNNLRSWLENTDFGYKYKEYSDEEIIPKLTTEEIDDIAMSYVHKDASNINGYWIDSSVIEGRTKMTKFAIYENVDIKYNDNNIIISYFAGKEHYHAINSMYLRIVKNNDTILYSNLISSNIVGVVDEHSTSEEYEKAISVKNKTAYFEVDFSGIDNNFDVIENNDTTKIDNNSFNYAIIFILVIAFLF